MRVPDGASILPSSASCSSAISFSSVDLPALAFLLDGTPAWAFGGSEAVARSRMTLPRGEECQTVENLVAWEIRNLLLDATGVKSPVY